jgi:uncharacterized protein YjbJ (UPF0337 family)
MTDDRISGTAKNIAGNVQEAYGSVTGDREQQVRGKAKQAEGTMQDLYGQAKDAAADTMENVQRVAHDADDLLRNYIEKRPYTVAVVALAAGWLLGRVGGRP